jgi:hypothetical protein
MNAPRGLSVFQSQQEIQTSNRRRADIERTFKRYKEKESLENKCNIKCPTKFPEQKAAHVLCQVCRTNVNNYFQHVEKYEHKAAWKDPRNLEYYNQLDDLIIDVSKDHFEMLQEMELILEEKENQSINSDMLMHPSLSKISHLKMAANGDSAEM